MLKSLLGEYNISGAHAIQWGVQHEDMAIAVYEQAENVQVERSGLWLSRNGIVGALPDGFVVTDKAIEVKCPYSARDVSLQSLASSKSFFLSCSPPQEKEMGMASSQSVDFDLNTKDKLGEKYYHQIQGVLHITGRSVCDLVVWTPSETVVITVSKEDEWAKNIQDIEEFYRQYFLPVFLEGGIDQ